MGPTFAFAETPRRPPWTFTKAMRELPPNWTPSPAGPRSASHPAGWQFTAHILPYERLGSPAAAQALLHEAREKLARDLGTDAKIGEANPQEDADGTVCASLSVVLPGGSGIALLGFRNVPGGTLGLRLIGPAHERLNLEREFDLFWSMVTPAPPPPPPSERPEEAPLGCALPGRVASPEEIHHLFQEFPRKAADIPPETCHYRVLLDAPNAPRGLRACGPGPELGPLGGIGAPGTLLDAGEQTEGHRRLSGHRGVWATGATSLWVDVQEPLDLRGVSCPPADLAWGLRFKRMAPELVGGLCLILVLFGRFPTGLRKQRSEGAESERSADQRLGGGPPPAGVAAPEQ
jgi:hypothetical protein